MIVGIPKEIKQQEYRVALTPECVKRLVQKGHKVLVEKSAGTGALFGDSDYLSAGATIADTHTKLYKSSELIVKVKEPLHKELALLTDKHLLFAFLHLASSRELTETLLARRVTAIAFETVETPDGRHPILAPMSEIAGRLAILDGAKCLQRPCGGVGKLLATFFPEEPAPKVVIIGAGVAGTGAARTAVALGAHPTILDINQERLNEISALFGNKVTAKISAPESLVESIRDADLVVGAVLRPGDKAPHIITREHLKLMKKGSVIVDIAIDQGGCVETSHPTTHSEPVFELFGVIHYCVANMPGSVPVTSTIALSKAIAPYVEEIADKGWRRALQQNDALTKGLSAYKGNLTCEPIARLFGLPYLPVHEALKE
jgi:alanine dehydrogenase